MFVGVAGFEPATSCSQSRRDNRATLHPEKGGKNNQKCIPAGRKCKKKPERSLYFSPNSIGSTHVAQALLFLLPNKLGQGIARSAIGHPMGGNSPQALDPLTWLRPFFSCSQTSLGRGIARSAIGHPMDPLTWLRPFFSCSQKQSTGPGSTHVAQALLFLLPSKLGQESPQKTQDSNAVRACGLR